MQDIYHQYQDFEIISLCIEDLIDTVKYYARQYDFLFLIDGDQSTWGQYYQSGFTPLWYILEPDDPMTVHGWIEVFDSTQIRTWIEECIGVEELPDQKLQPIKIGPNPSRGMVSISTQGPFSVEIFDVGGSLVDKIDSPKRNVTWDCRDIPAGIYIFRIKNGKDYRFSKVAIVR